ncbi:MAG: hypothetical protein QOD70_3157 [Frankiales bacterium]|jgi:hypothetical protein|nr:hypothetical protein [Frankiales bacterium]MCW2706986.1 hypothetical protein [Frankiales bacterium]MDX6268417.1 hypothetical protein [Frankiales bacterium]
MSNKNKSGREARKPVQDKNKKSKGQTPPPRTVEGLTATSHGKH